MSRGASPKRVADCGATYDHDPHLYRTERGRVKACDGSVTKRSAGPGRGVSS